MGLVITEYQWENTLRKVHTASVYIRHSLVQFKVLHCLHYSKVKLSKMYPNVDATCDQCRQFPAILAHMLWLFPQIYNYWKSVFQNLSNTVGEAIEPDPLIATFSVLG